MKDGTFSFGRNELDSEDSIVTPAALVFEAIEAGEAQARVRRGPAGKIAFAAGVIWTLCVAAFTAGYLSLTGAFSGPGFPFTELMLALAAMIGPLGFLWLGAVVARQAETLQQQADELRDEIGRLMTTPPAARGKDQNPFSGAAALRSITDNAREALREERAAISAAVSRLEEIAKSPGAYPAALDDDVVEEHEGDTAFEIAEPEVAFDDTLVEETGAVVEESLAEQEMPELYAPSVSDADEAEHFAPEIELDEPRFSDPAPVEPEITAPEASELETIEIDPADAHDADDQPVLPLPGDQGPEQRPLNWRNVAMALDFPKSEEDHEVLNALYSVLPDPQIASLLQASEDVLSLLAEENLYMDSLDVRPTQGALWCRYAMGQRDESSGLLMGVEDEEAIAKVAERLSGDGVFMDAALHFIRRYDAVLRRAVRDANDLEIGSSLADSRTGRAFMLIGATQGCFR